jgi:HEAT repeat protein
VRIAAARALGRIGGSEAEALLGKAQQSHENMRAQLQRFVDDKAYRELIPGELSKEDDRGAARELLDELARRLLHEQEAVLFYIRQAFIQSREAPSG